MYDMYQEVKQSSPFGRARTIAVEFYSLVKKAFKEGKVFPITDVSTT